MARNVNYYTSHIIVLLDFKVIILKEKNNDGKKELCGTVNNPEYLLQSMFNFHNGSLLTNNFFL